MRDPVASNLRPVAARWLPVTGCALAGLAVFQFFGNATRGYIHTRSLFWWWGSQWFDPAAETTHGILILGLSAWLLGRGLRREGREPGARGWGAKGPTESPGSPIQGSGGGGEPVPGDGNQKSASPNPKYLAAMLGGLALHLLGYAVQQTRLSILALLLFAWGVLALAGGRRWARAAAFPLGFMVFAIPFNALDTLGFHLRLWVTDAGCAAARLAGIEVLRNGTQLLSPHGGYQYDVAAACSGVRSLVALAALSLLVGYLYLRPWWARTLVLLLGVPYALAGNVVRIFGLIVAAEWLGQKAGAAVHEGLGFLVFVIVLALQALTVAVLRKWIPGTGNRKKGTGADEAMSPEPCPVSGIRFPGWTMSAAICACAALTALAAHRLDVAQVSPQVGVRLAADGRNPADLPEFLGGDWMGQEVPVSAVERDLLPPDTGFSRKNYVSVRNPLQQVYVSVVLSGRDRTSIHRPELCLVGQGWTIDGRSGHRFRRAGGMAAGFPATVLRVRREVVLPRQGRATVRSLVVYWFVGHDRVVATHGERMLWGAWDRLRHLQGHRWAYVVVQTGAADGEAAALARMQAVLDLALPALEPPSG